MRKFRQDHLSEQWASKECCAAPVESHLKGEAVTSRQLGGVEGMGPRLRTKLSARLDRFLESVQAWKVWASYLFPSLSRKRLTVKVPEVFYFEFALKVTDLDVCWFQIPLHSDKFFHLLSALALG